MRLIVISCDCMYTRQSCAIWHICEVSQVEKRLRLLWDGLCSERLGSCSLICVQIYMYILQTIVATTTMHDMPEQVHIKTNFAVFFIVCCELKRKCIWVYEERAQEQPRFVYVRTHCTIYTVDTSRKWDYMNNKGTV